MINIFIAGEIFFFVFSLLTGNMDGYFGHLVGLCIGSFIVIVLGIIINKIRGI